MITSVSVPSIAQTLVEACKIGLVAVSSSLNGNRNVAASTPGQLLPLLISGAVPTVNQARWGVLGADQEPIFFCNVDSQRYAQRGLIIANYVEIEITDDRGTHRTKIFDSEGCFLKMGAVFDSASPKAPLSCAILLCQSNGLFTGLGGVQPLFLGDRQCIEFFVQGSDAVPLHEIAPLSSIRIEPSGRLQTAVGHQVSALPVHFPD